MATYQQKRAAREMRQATREWRRIARYAASLARPGALIPGATVAGVLARQLPYWM